MARIYTISTGAFAPAAAKTIFEAFSVVAAPFRIKRIELSSDNTAGTTVVFAKIERLTATGTGTAVVPAAVDANDAAAVTTAKLNDTIEPTKGVALWGVQWNLQVPYIWVASPGEELRAGNAGGIGIELLSNPAQNIEVAVTIEED